MLAFKPNLTMWIVTPESLYFLRSSLYLSIGEDKRHLRSSSARARWAACCSGVIGGRTAPGGGAPCPPGAPPAAPWGGLPCPPGNPPRPVAGAPAYVSTGSDCNSTELTPS